MKINDCINYVPFSFQYYNTIITLINYWRNTCDTEFSIPYLGGGTNRSKLGWGEGLILRCERTSSLYEGKGGGIQQFYIGRRERLVPRCDSNSSTVRGRVKLNCLGGGQASC